MSPDDVHPHEMPDDLTDLLDDLRAAAAATPPPVPGEALAMLFRDGAVGAIRSRRRPLAWVAAAVSVGAVSFGGLGVAGALPDPVQRRVADVLDDVGIDVPDGHPSSSPRTTTTSTTSTTSGEEPSTGTTVAPGRSGEAPGHTDEQPGRSGDAPGQDGERGRPQEPGGDRAKGRNPEKTTTTRIPARASDVHPPDRPERARFDDDGGRKS